MVVTANDRRRRFRGARHRRRGDTERRRRRFGRREGVGEAGSREVGVLGVHVGRPILGVLTVYAHMRRVWSRHGTGHWRAEGGSVAGGVGRWRGHTASHGEFVEFRAESFDFFDGFVEDHGFLGLRFPTHSLTNGSNTETQMLSNMIAP